MLLSCRWRWECPPPLSIEPIGAGVPGDAGSRYNLCMDLNRINTEFGRDPRRLTAWALSLGRSPIVSTSFGPYAAVTLHLASQIQPDIPVLWVDAGYGTPAMYRFADALTAQLGLKLHIVRPRRSRAHREAAEGPLPLLGDPRHAEFTREVKLEPFDRALTELRAGVWLTGIRGEETAARAEMQPVSMTANGLVKVAPVLHWHSQQMHEYLKQHSLPNNFDYFDPTKVDDSRECGLHLAP